MALLLFSDFLIKVVVRYKALWVKHLGLILIINLGAKYFYLNVDKGERIKA